MVVIGYIVVFDCPAMKYAPYIYFNLHQTKVILMSIHVVFEGMGYSNLTSPLGIASCLVVVLALAVTMEQREA